MENPPQEKKSNLGLIGWILFGLGVFLMFKSLVFFFIYGPLFLASFIISIILMTRKQIGSGISLLLLTLIVPPILGVGIFAKSVGDTMNTMEEKRNTEAQEKTRYIRFEEIKIFTEYDYMYCEGKVRNTGNKTFDFVKVKVEWLDKNDNVLDTDWTYAVSSEGLGPNEAKSFKVMTKSDRRMKSGRYYIIE